MKSAAVFPLLLVLCAQRIPVSSSARASRYGRTPFLASTTASSTADAFVRPTRQNNYVQDSLLAVGLGRNPHRDHVGEDDDDESKGSAGRTHHQLMTLLSLNIPRGGDLGPLSGTKLAITVGSLAGVDALFGSVAPITSLKWLGIDMPDRDFYRNMARHYVHGIGSAGAATSVLLLLRLLAPASVSLEQALGCSFGVRLLTMTVLMVTGKLGDLGMNGTIFGLTWLILGGTAGLLLSGYQTELAMSLTKTVSFLLAIHGYFLFTIPKLFVEKALDKAGQGGEIKKTAPRKKARMVSDEDETALATTINLAAMNGGYMAMSGAVAYLLAHGQDVVHVAGYVAIGWVPIWHRLIQTVTQDKCLGIPKGVWRVLISPAMAVIAVGCLSPPGAAAAAAARVVAPVVVTSPAVVPPIPVAPPSQPVE